MQVANTGFRECGLCCETYDYAPDSPPHVCPGGEPCAEDNIKTGMALAAAILVRDFDNHTHALEVLGAAGINAENIAGLNLDDYDLKPLRAAFAAASN